MPPLVTKCSDIITDKGKSKAQPLKLGHENIKLIMHTAHRRSTKLGQEETIQNEFPNSLNFPFCNFTLTFAPIVIFTVTGVI